MNAEQPNSPKDEVLIGVEIARHLVDETDRLSGDHSLEIKRMIVELFDGQEPEVIFSHSGRINKGQKTGVYRTMAFTTLSPDHGLATGSRTRVMATAEISKALPDLKIVTNSFNRFDPTEPVMAQVVKSELINRGVRPDNIETEGSSFSTVTQLVEMVKMAVRNMWTMIAAMTNEFHTPRMMEMYSRLDTIIDDVEFQETLKEFKELNPTVKFITAEQILRVVNPRYVEYLDKVKDTPEFAATVAAEAKGLADLKAGKYRVVLNPEAPRNPK